MFIEIHVKVEKLYLFFTSDWNTIVRPLLKICDSTILLLVLTKNIKRFLAAKQSNTNHYRHHGSTNKWSYRGHWRDRVAGVGGVVRVVRTRVHVARGGVHAAVGDGAAARAGRLRAAAARPGRARLVASRHSTTTATLL